MMARRQLSETYARHLLWKRAADVSEEVRARLAPVLLNLPLEKAIETCWTWYGPLMQARRQQQFRDVGDRRDILAIDGNAKLHRRTCAMPFAEVVWSEAGCGRGSLGDRGSSSEPRVARDPSMGLREH